MSENVSTEGFIVLKIGAEAFTLTGTVGTDVIVAYHSPFNEAINLGTIGSIAGEVGNALGLNGADFQNTVNSGLDALKPVPSLGNVVGKFETASIRITDLAINTQTNKYQFGFAFDFSGDPPEALGISLQAFGVKVTYDKNG